MKVRIEMADDSNEEIIIRCRQLTDEIRLLQDVICSTVDKNSVMSLTQGDTEYYISRGEILFFETESGKTAAHTADGMYYTDYRLRELEQLLPSAFVRASKSCIVNTTLISSIKKNITGASEITFRKSHKKVYVSRLYFRMFYERVNELRSSR